MSALGTHDARCPRACDTAAREDAGEAQRLDAKGKDTFDLGGFWRENEVGKGIDAFAFVLRTVLAHSPNSIPPER
eukprot:3225394-Prymnesium_polylepis.1